MPTENRCWQCTYCDKEHVKVSAGVYAENGIGHCAAENSKANGKNRFHAFVFERTMQIDCAEFKPITQKIITKHPKMSTTIKTEKEVEVKFIHVEAGVRYWEDAAVDGVDDELGELPDVGNNVIDSKHFKQYKVYEQITALSQKLQASEALAMAMEQAKSKEIAEALAAEALAKQIAEAKKAAEAAKPKLATQASLF